MSLQYHCALLEIFIRLKLEIFEIYNKFCFFFQDALMEKILTMRYNLLQF